MQVSLKQACLQFLDKIIDKVDSIVWILFKGQHDNMKHKYNLFNQNKNKKQMEKQAQVQKWSISYYLPSFTNNPSPEEIQQVSNCIQKIVEYAMTQNPGTESLSELRIELEIENCYPVIVDEQELRKLLDIEHLPSIEAEIHNNWRRIQIEDFKYWVKEEEDEE